MATARLGQPYNNVEELFRNCVVRIPERGTGFFVAPNLILTCSHLFERDGATSVQVYWHPYSGKATVQCLQTKEEPSKPDLALLEVTWDEGKQINHPCVMLIGGAERGDQFTAFGHPGAPDPFEVGGDTLSFDFSGPSFDKFGIEYIRASGERAIGGFSGSPVFNCRTLGVCGVLAMSNNTAAAEGGRFLPARLIFQGFPELVDKQSSYHLENPTWSDFLPGTQLWTEVWRNSHSCAGAFETAFGPEANHNVPFVAREIEVDFASFVASPCSAMVIIGQSGMGKTTLIQRLLGKYEEQEGNLCAVFESARLPLTVPEVERYILDKLGRNEATIREFWAKISPECVKRKKCLIVFVDAVNEYNSGRASGARPTDLLEKLDGMITSTFTDHRNIKFVITCRPETWRRARDSARSMFAENKGAYYVSQKGIAHVLPPFSETEMKAAYENYRNVRNIATPFQELSFLAKHQLRDPLLLSLASEVYSGQEIPDDLDTGEVFDKYYLGLKRSHSTIEAIVSEFFTLSSGRNISDTISRTAIVRDVDLQIKDPRLHADLDMTDEGSIGFQLKKQKVLREWTIQPDENVQANRLEIQIRFTYDRFAEFLLSNRLLQIIQERTRSGKTLENAAIEVVTANLAAGQQMVIVFGALRRTLVALQRKSTDYAVLLEGITRSDPRSLALVTSVLARIARSENGIEVVGKLFKRLESRVKLKNGQETRFPLIDVVYRMLRDEEYRYWLAEKPEKQRRHLDLLYGYFPWGLQHPDEKVSASAIQYLFFLWRGEDETALDDAVRITNRAVQFIRRASLFSYVLYGEQKRLLPNVWGVLCLVVGESPQDEISQPALAAMRETMLRLRLRRSAIFRSLLPFTKPLTIYVERILKNLRQPVKLESLDNFFLEAGYKLRLSEFEEVMGFFAPDTTPAMIAARARKLSEVQNGIHLQMMTFALSVCYERQESEEGKRQCLVLLEHLFYDQGAQCTSQYCASLALYHVNYFGAKASKESLELMGRMAQDILKERRGRFMILGKKESFNIIGTYGRGLYKNGEILDDGTAKGTTKRALQYAIDALQQAKDKNVRDFEYYNFVCENIGLLGVLIKPEQVLDLIATVLRDFPELPEQKYDAPFSHEQMTEARETVLMSLANIRVLYRQEVDRFLLDELESPGLYEEVANQRMPQFSLATFFSWAFEQLMFRILTKYYTQAGGDVVRIFIECARSGSTGACLGAVVERMVGLVNEFVQ